MTCILPTYIPKLCFFLSISELTRKYQFITDYEIFFCSNCFTFEYKINNSKDIQEKCNFFSHEKALAHLSETLNFKCTYHFRYDYNHDINNIKHLHKKNGQVVAIIHLAALPHGQFEANSLRNETYHCVRIYDVNNGQFLIYDDYVPSLNDTFIRLKTSLDIKKSWEYIQNYFSIDKPKVILNKNMFTCIVNKSLSNFLVSHKENDSKSGIEALACLIDDLEGGILAWNPMQPKNLIGLLFVLKYQLYPAYCYLLEAMISIHLNMSEMKHYFTKTNMLWKTLFIKLNFMFVRPDMRQVKRITDCLKEIRTLLKTIIELSLLQISIEKRN